MTIFHVFAFGIYFERIWSMNEFIQKLGLSEDDEVEMLPIISLNENEDEQDIDEAFSSIPVLPLKNTVLFPKIVLPISVGREKSISSVKSSHSGDKYIVVVTQKNQEPEEPNSDDLYRIGVLSKILKLIKMPDGSITVIIQGKQKVLVKNYTQEEPFFKADVATILEKDVVKSTEFDALLASIRDLAQKTISLSPNIPAEAAIMLKNIEQNSFLLNFIASNLNIKLNEKQEILELHDLELRAKMVLDYLKKEIEMLELKHQIKSKVDNDIMKQQREYFLNQQLKVIQEELGGTDSNQKEIESLQERAKNKKWNKQVGDVFQKELSRLQRMHPASMESGVLHSYLDTLLELPWGEMTEDKIDLVLAEKILHEDHFGLEKIKQRILEYLAVLKLKGDMKSPILCFVGPPGVGKTSLGKSIARALNRQYARIALGGLHDEAEIRGHRKTYIGAMPGRIIQTLKKVKSSNPVFILDEIDKVGADHRGDPSSALLELLDPEQNNSFYDNYLELEYDLSKVMFIATANNLSRIQPALLDRMEIIQLSGYSIEEKLSIAKLHLIKKQKEAHGLKSNAIKLSDKTLQEIIEKYTRESGVRELDRMLASVMRNAAKKIVMETEFDNSVKPEMLSEILGPERYNREMYEKSQPAGVAVGLAWTQTGGDILYIESILTKGKGGFTLTGNLGDVMKESASAAFSLLKSHGEELKINNKIFENYNIHIHVPDGAIPKDGPSAGITMLTAMTSLFTQRRVRNHVAMTGEITLRGKVTPVGGIKEKILAAKRAGIKEIILCKWNEKDVIEVGEMYTKGLKFHYVENWDEVIQIALEEKISQDYKIDFIQ